MHVDTSKILEILGEENLQPIINNFIESLSIKNCVISHNITNIITNLVDNIAHANQQKASSAYIRITSSNGAEHYEQDYRPIWHVDSCADAIINEKEKYFCNSAAYTFVLKGAATLFYPLSIIEREKIISINKNYNYIAYEHGLENLNIEQSTSAKFGEGVVFLTGINFGAVHAIPLINTERLFVLVTPTDDGEISRLKEWKEHRNELL